VTNNQPIRRAAIAKTLDLEQPASGRRRVWLWLAMAAALIAMGVIGVGFFSGRNEGVRYETAKVERGGLTVIVTATGTLQPTNQVDVGSELSGIIKTVEADFNDTVTISQVLARLDTAKLEAQVV